MQKNTNIIIMIIVLILIVSIGIIMFNSTETETENNQKKERVVEDATEDKDKEEKEEENNKLFLQRIENTVEEFIGAPQKRGPLDEDNLYTEDGFDSTTLVLSTVAKTHSPESPAEIMKKINYYPQGEVSYETRLHFSTYRNKVSQYFEDITEEVGGDYTQQKTVLLNKVMDNGKRLLDIDWEEEITFYYIPKEYIIDIIDNFPQTGGVMFVIDGDEDMGLDVRGEGIIINKTNFVYACPEEKEVIVVDFLDHLQELEVNGIIVYTFNEIE